MLGVVSRAVPRLFHAVSTPSSLHHQPSVLWKARRTVAASLTFGEDAFMNIKEYSLKFKKNIYTIIMLIKNSVIVWTVNDADQG